MVDLVLRVPLELLRAHGDFWLSLRMLNVLPQQLLVVHLDNPRAILLLGLVDADLRRLASV